MKIPFCLICGSNQILWEHKKSQEMDEEEGKPSQMYEEVIVHKQSL